MNTFLEILSEIKDLLLERINVFNQGYAHARLDPGKGLVVTTGNESRYVGINDVEGDYFYIRVPDAITSVTTKAKTDCNVAISQKYFCTIVAVVNEADEFQLSDAIVNVLLKTKVVDVKAVWLNAIAIVENEFRGLAKDAMNAVKARIGNRTIVRIDFDLTRVFETHNCEYQICKPC